MSSTSCKAGWAAWARWTGKRSSGCWDWTSRSTCSTATGWGRHPAARQPGPGNANFWLALMVMIYPAIWSGWSPPMRLIRFSEDPLGNLGMCR